ncbi:MAG: hypothetical protein RLY49_210 [Candidatus Parcubacteria bacterium]|jgi:NTP pyrophosphatase (non-canonical NTP hydrolase)
MNPIQRLTQKIVEFRDARNWKQFHNPKDLALSLVLEAGEVMEHFQWKNKEEMDKYLVDKKEEISEELADVLYWILLMSHDFDINIEEALERKLDINNQKYPIEKSKDKHTKYNKL